MLHTCNTNGYVNICNTNGTCMYIRVHVILMDMFMYM